MSGVNYVTFDDLALGGAGGQAANTANTDYITVSFNPDAKVVTGALEGKYAAPVLSNNNGANFGGQGNGVDATHYITSGSDGGSSNAMATLTFNSDQHYFGMLWGSVDTYNNLEFFDGATSLGIITGGMVDANATGDQGINGTFYVNIDSSDPFDRVVASSTQYAFEFDNVAYGSDRIIPEPAYIIAWCLIGSVFGIGYYRRRR